MEIAVFANEILIAYLTPHSATAVCASRGGKGKRREPLVLQTEVVFLLEFIFEEGTPDDTRVETIKDLQEFFRKV